MLSRNVLFVDVETSGLDEKIHSVLSCGIVLTDKNLNVIEDAYYLIQPKQPFMFTKYALKINGFESPYSFENHLPVSKFLHIFHTNFGQQKDIPLLAGWNVSFDINFLQNIYKEGNLQWPFNHRFLDVQSISLFLNKCEDMTLHSILQKYNKKSNHHALQDAYDALFLLKEYYSLYNEKTH